MSTSGHSLYRPIKISDILSLGFEIHETKNSVEHNRICVRISKDKIQEYVDWSDTYYESIVLDKPEIHDYYYLYLDGFVNRKSHDCIWSFTRYNVNSPALNYFLESLSLLGYKMNVEGERYNYELEMIRKEFMKKYSKNLVETE